MPDFAELANYLAGQIELGEEKVYLDEPWELEPMRPKVSRPELAKSPSAARASFEVPRVPSPQPVSSGVSQIVIPESAKSKSRSAYDSATTLSDFYEKVSREKFYSQAQFARGEGNLESPKLLLVVYAPAEKYLENGFALSDVGQMVLKMFGSLNLSKEEIGLSYFCKKNVGRALLPQVAMACKRMLEKEVSLIRPQTIVFFGDRLLKQALSQNAKAVDFGGTPLEFAHVPATDLIDPEEMLGNKQLKWITWKVHIPKCGFFV